MKKRIIFICNGNIYRSVIAAACLKKILHQHHLDATFSVSSYGLQGTDGTAPPKHTQLSEYPEEWAAAKPVLQNIDIDISTHRFKKISRRVMQNIDVAVAMDTLVYTKATNALLKQFPDDAQKIHCFSELTTKHQSIQDPAGSGNSRLHKKIIGDIASTIEQHYSQILQWAK